MFSACSRSSAGCSPARRAQRKPELFCSSKNVTSDPVGEDNALGACGHNRDGKKGKKHIVIGLLCDEEGSAVSTEVFRCNMYNPRTMNRWILRFAQTRPLPSELPKELCPGQSGGTLRAEYEALWLPGF